MASSATAKPRARQGTRRPAAGKGRAPAWLARWWKVALLVLLVTIGLPLAHALFGEVVALLGLAALIGFLVGRWTAA
ncbi:hypothetical protein DFH01_10070 [Falsiroseomonas bella]|uniref:Uncharacterized protein n=1 Tax=Falsiroseomonas bella TaxID=2184016 RepID=A0A317FHT5_9PROT|nr:hypothetical protein [Falsiroseomonas bella]PWS37198.1 hypothetical protein DFH01_10070 [Falsiroseomonas bella]